MARVDQVAEGIYRISVFEPEKRISFNQFVIDDERPTLIHTGQYPIYEEVRAAVSQVIDPSQLEYVVVPHFEADECGGMGRFVAAAKQALLLCSAAGARINLTQWDYAGPVKGLQDGDVVDLGKHKLRFLETPHVHHWDSMMVFDETTRSLFPSDLFIQPGEQPPIVRENLGKDMCRWYQAAELFAGEKPVLRVVDYLATLNPEWVHPMHGGSLTSDVLPGYVHALRTEPFVFDGRVFGRMLPW